jgi:hypothetical protein
LLLCPDSCNYYLFLKGPDGAIDLRRYVEKPWEDYCRDAARDGVWGDHVHLLAAAHAFQRDICVVTSSQQGGSENCLTWISSPDPSYGGGPFLLGHIWESHYQSLMPRGMCLKNICNCQFLFWYTL